MRYLVTGGSGYIGTRLVDRLAERDETERVVIADIRPPASFRPKVSYERLDVRDAAGARALLERERPDALVHLAFVLNPMHDQNAMYEIDVGGTHNMLEAASAAGTQHVLVTSSSTAYGAFPENPVPIDEEWPVRGVPDFEYARDKAECDRMCQLWALKHPDRAMTIVRPCIVFGPNVDNYVHEDDVGQALIRLLDGRHEGAFNLAGDGTMTWRECSEMIGMPVRRVPRRLYWMFGELMWRLRLSETPPGNREGS